jgi:hypothetical protein
MGGQACVFYGAAQFSRDVDLAILPTTENLDRLHAALAELQAEVIAVPPFESRFLTRGLAVHFRCHHPACDGFRIDVMSVMRGVDPFDLLWERRTTLELPPGEAIELMGIADLVRAKKTQRDRDWPMIGALVEAHYEQYRDDATPERVAFWLEEGRTPETLIRIAAAFPEIAPTAAAHRPLVRLAESNEIDKLRKALLDEQLQVQDLDRQYWKPLKAELERLRNERTRNKDRGE